MCLLKWTFSLQTRGVADDQSVDWCKNRSTFDRLVSVDETGVLVDSVGVCDEPLLVYLNNSQ